MLVQDLVDVAVQSVMLVFVIRGAAREQRAFRRMAEQTRCDQCGLEGTVRRVRATPWVDALFVVLMLAAIAWRVLIDMHASPWHLLARVGIPITVVVLTCMFPLRGRDICEACGARVTNWKLSLGK